MTILSASLTNKRTNDDVLLYRAFFGVIFRSVRPIIDCLRFQIEHHQRGAFIDDHSSPMRATTTSTLRTLAAAALPLAVAAGKKAAAAAPPPPPPPPAGFLASLSLPELAALAPLRAFEASHLTPLAETAGLPVDQFRYLVCLIATIPLSFVVFQASARARARILASRFTTTTRLRHIALSFARALASLPSPAPRATII